MVQNYLSFSRFYEFWNDFLFDFVLFQFGFWFNLINEHFTLGRFVSEKPSPEKCEKFSPDVIGLLYELLESCDFVREKLPQNHPNVDVAEYYNIFFDHVVPKSNFKEGSDQLTNNSIDLE